MIIFEDTRQQAHKHDLKHRYFEAHGVKVVRQCLNVGDYTLPTNQSVCIDTKKGIKEVCQNLTSNKEEHERFRGDCERAQELGIRLIVLIEEDATDGNGRYAFNSVDDVCKWVNPRLKKYPRATTGGSLMKTMKTMNRKYGVEWMFCRSRDAGSKIIELLGEEQK